MAKLKNFTPLLDSLVKRYKNTITPAVWGRVWRYEQMGGGKCVASKDKMAGELGISVRTFQRHIDMLIKDEYVIDHTPDWRNKPHELNTTRKARVEITVEAIDEGASESRTGMTESHSDYDRESHEERVKKQVKNTPSKDGEDPLVPSTPQSKRMFEVINRDRRAKGYNDLKKFATIQQREDTEAALKKIDEAGELEKALRYAMINGRHERVAFCRAMMAWAKNLDKPKKRPTQRKDTSSLDDHDPVAYQREYEQKQKEARAILQGET